jgi:hypothetical protein
LPFSFDLMPRLKRWGTCRLMGPACHPLCTIKVHFLGFFHPLIFGNFFFLLNPCRLSNGDTAAAKWDPHVILYVQ